MSKYKIVSICNGQGILRNCSLSQVVGKHGNPTVHCYSPLLLSCADKGDSDLLKERNGIEYNGGMLLRKIAHRDHMDGYEEFGHFDHYSFNNLKSKNFGYLDREGGLESGKYLFTFYFYKGA